MPTFQSVATSNVFGSSLTIAAPAGIMAGELLIVEVSFSDDEAVTATPADAGFTQLFLRQDLNNSTAGIWYKVADGSEGDLTFSHSGASDHMAASYARYSETGGIDVSTNGTTGFGSTVTIPGLTASADNSLSLIGAIVDADPPYTDPAGYTRRWYATRTGSSVYGLDAAVNAGATGDITINAGESQVFYVYHIILSPSGGGASVVSPTLSPRLGISMGLRG